MSKRIDVEASGITFRDLLFEALAALVQRPTRTVLTMLGTVLGVGAFVVVVGLTETASAQISTTFAKQDTRQVLVEDVGLHPASQTVDSFLPIATRRSSTSTALSPPEGPGSFPAHQAFRPSQTRIQSRTCKLTRRRLATCRR